MNEGWDNSGFGGDGFEAGGGFSRRYGKQIRLRPAVALLIFGAIFAVLGAGLIGGSFIAQSQASVSSYTQAHGIRENAVVQDVSVSTQTHCTGSRHRSFSHTSNCSVTYDARVTVSLPRPVGGHSDSVVHVAQDVAYPHGQAIGVLVDPKDPGYAELPGVPYATQASVLVLRIVGGVFLLVGIGLLVCTRVVRRRRSGR